MPSVENMLVAQHLVDNFRADPRRVSVSDLIPAIAQALDAKDGPIRGGASPSEVEVLNSKIDKLAAAVDFMARALARMESRGETPCSPTARSQYQPQALALDVVSCPPA